MPRPCMQITGLEANLLLFALDRYLTVDTRTGKVMDTEPGHTVDEVQHLRDGLLAHHQHPACAE